MHEGYGCPIQTEARGLGPPKLASELLARRFGTSRSGSAICLDRGTKHPRAKVVLRHYEKLLWLAALLLRVRIRSSAFCSDASIFAKARCIGYTCKSIP